MRIFLLFLLLIFLPVNLFAGDLLYSQDFESSDWADEFTGASSWSDHITRTINAPHSGTYAIRWNQDSTRTDPITGLVGIGNSVFDWRGPNNDIVSKTPNELYLRFWIRHDDYSNDAGYDNSARKTLYYVDNVYGVGAMYLKFQLGTVFPTLSYANGSYASTWATNNWGYSSMSFDAVSAGLSASLSGTWRKIETYWNYDDHYMQMWVDGILLYPRTDGSMATYWTTHPTAAALGRIHYDPNLTLNWRGFQFGYFDQSRDLVNGSDGTGYTAGIQFDDLEIWDGMPGESEEATVQGISITGGKIQ